MIDPITLEVIRHRLKSIADEMELTLLKSAYSSIIKEGLDASTAIFDIHGQTIAQGNSIPIHLGSLIPAVRAILDKFPPSTMKDGDAYILNNPYHGGTHLPDITIIAPVVYQGEPVALGCTIAHHQDIGGKTPGSIPPDATEIFQEGLIMPPLKLYEAGRPNETIHEIIKCNVRIPDVVMGDIRAQLAACHVAKTRIPALLDEYDKGVVLDAMKTLLDNSEAATRRVLEDVPDGTYSFTDYLDNDGIDMDIRPRIKVTVTVKGSDISFDFTGSSPQVKGPFNSPMSSTLSTVYYIVRAITGADISTNSGCFRPIKVTLPDSSIVNPSSPAPVNSRTATVKRITDVLHGALVQAVPGKLPAASSGQLLVMALGGIDPATNRAYVTSELGAGGMGARPNADGIDAVETDVTNCMNIPAESIEMDYPIRIMKSRLWDDSGGAGKFRGGLGLEKVFEVGRGEATITYRGERHTVPPWGLFGGLPGKMSMARIVRKTGEVEEVAPKATLRLGEGDQLHTFTAGGAGYGDPLDRDPGLVLEDVLDRRVSISSALEDYGVVIDSASQQVDQDATGQRRSRMAEDRGPVDWTYDLGVELGRV
ncbi:MAG: hydantoinase B/oxoprolinase family protein [Chloroflexi bacterium]|nr:hydantoinase B/oxoprolinase family protein [Chloroflexota bacterium]